MQCKVWKACSWNHTTWVKWTGFSCRVLPLEHLPQTEGPRKSDAVLQLTKYQHGTHHPPHHRKNLEQVAGSVHKQACQTVHSDLLPVAVGSLRHHPAEIQWVKFHRLYLAILWTMIKQFHNILGNYNTEMSLISVFFSFSIKLPGDVIGLFWTTCLVCRHWFDITVAVNTQSGSCQTSLSECIPKYSQSSSMAS